MRHVGGQTRITKWFIKSVCVMVTPLCVFVFHINNGENEKGHVNGNKNLNYSFFNSLYVVVVIVDVLWNYVLELWYTAFVYIIITCEKSQPIENSVRIQDMGFYRKEKSCISSVLGIYMYGFLLITAHNIFYLEYTVCFMRSLFCENNWFFFFLM